MELRFDGLHKRYGALRALEDASLVARSGTLHALLGENGAGKTTLVRTAYGLVQPDRGVIALDGRPFAPASPVAAMAAGVGMVHQHFALIPDMTVAENVVLGRRGRFHPRRAADHVRSLAADAGLDLDPTARVASLSVASRQRVEIVKAISRNARVLILDEPTAVLAPLESRALFDWLRRYVAGGGTVILITHKLREALEVADDLTVLRHGRTVLTGPAAALDEATLAEAMLGPSPESRTPLIREVLGEPQTTVGSSERRAEVVAELREVTVVDSGRSRLVPTSLSIRGGEIVGIAGVEGSGERELLRLIAGRLEATTGTAKLPDRIGFVPEDRHEEGLVLPFTLTENVALNGAGRRRGQMDWRGLAARTVRIMRDHDVRAPHADVHAATLSGGNQQKLILGRELADAPPLLVVENPTRGLDLRAAAAVHAALREAAAAGAAVVIHSSDLDEVLALSHRIVVVHAGRAREMMPERDLVGRAMLGVA